MTCGAAETRHFFTRSIPASRRSSTPSRDTQLVTMTIGGNDSGVFINADPVLRQRRLTLGQGSPCKDRYGSSFETPSGIPPTPPW